MSKESAQEILNLFKSNYDVNNQDEFGVELTAKDGTHKVRLTGSTVTFHHPTNVNISYSMGANSTNIRAFFKRMPTFDPEMYAGDVPAEKPKREPKSATAKAAATPKEPKPAKSAAPAGDKKPSARAQMIALFNEGKTKEQVLETLIPLHPDRDAKSLKNQISLNFSEWKKKTGNATSTPAASPAPAEEAAPAAAPQTKIEEHFGTTVETVIQ